MDMESKMRNTDTGPLPYYWAREP